MKKGIVSLIGIILLFLIGICIYNNISETKEKTSKVSLEETKNKNEKLSKEIDDFQNYLLEKNGFYEQVEKRLSENGYKATRIVMAYSNEDIWVKYVLKNREVNKHEKEKVKSIFNNVAIKNNLDTKIFRVSVSNNASE